MHLQKFLKENGLWFMFSSVEEQIKFISKYHTAFLIDCIDYIPFREITTRQWRTIRKDMGEKQFDEVNLDTTFVFEIPDDSRRGG